MNILITGTSRGIGKSLANSFLARGFGVIGCSRSSKDIIQHDNYEHYECDVTSEESIVSMAKNVRRSKKTIDVLINNAGIASMNHSLLTPGSTVKKVLAVNVFGTFVTSREFSKLLKKSSNASIVNFTTVATPLDLEGEAIYAASKSAVESLTKVLAKELSPLKIRVNAIGPTPVDTALIAAVPKEKIEELIQKQSIKRKGVFDDVLNVIDFFIQPESSFITGQIIYLGGVN